MFCSEFLGYALWWIFPLVMIVLCILTCGLMMMRRKGSMPYRSGSCCTDSRHAGSSGSALHTIDERYAGEEIGKEGHEGKKRES